MVFRFGPPDKDLDDRDIGAVAYSKTTLTEGDTLVFIDNPAGAKLYDAKGFQLATHLRVHSSKLLATDSPVFRKMFEPIQQARVKRAHNFSAGNSLPAGIDYVLDLSPALEGDDAIEQVLMLSSPDGVLYWATAEGRCRVPSALVGGRDDTSEQPDRTDQTQLKSLDENDPDNMDVAEGSHPLAMNVKPSNHVRSAIANGHKFPEEYSKVRHCTCVEKLLQIIEGKDPRLDSAPKVWTVTMLAKFYDCADAVVDAVSSWCLTERNIMIIEILPEVTLRLGLTLESQFLTRSAFSILVSEEAFHLAGKGLDHLIVPSDSESRTRFGRVRDRLDEDTLNVIQHAGHSLHARIEAESKKLTEVDLTWLQNLPEYSKLVEILNYYKSQDEEDAVAIKKIESVMDGLRHFIRGRIFYCLYQEVTYDQARIASEHRASEQYKSRADIDYKVLYDGFSVAERVCTQQFWLNLDALEWSINSHDQHIYQPLPLSNPYSYLENDIKVTELCNVEKVMLTDMHSRTSHFNELVIETIGKGYKGGVMPPEAFVTEELRPGQTYWSGRWSQIPNMEFWTDSYSPLATRTFHVPSMTEMHSTSPFFNIAEMLVQVKQHIRGVCHKMLSSGENNIFNLPETLLCLTDDEYKYLPLFAGGLNDGTGGVYEAIIPPALAGPSGPGPSYHTGFSTTSASSSEVDFDGGSDFGASSSTVGAWSRAVENGFSDHVDRRYVQSEVDFGSTGFSDLGLDPKGTGSALSEDSFEVVDKDETEKECQKFDNNKNKGKKLETSEEDVDVKPESDKEKIAEEFDVMDDNFFLTPAHEADFDNDDSGEETETEETHTRH